MNKKTSLEPLYSALRDLIDWFQKANCPCVIIGGIAISFLGRPRTTRDINVLAFPDEAGLPEFLKLGKEFGFKGRRSDVLTFARRNRVLLMRHQPTVTDVDISLGALPFESESLKRARKLRIADIAVPLPSPEDLIIMKAVAHRPIDLEDIRSVIEVNSTLDFRRIRYWVRKFAKVLEAPEIFDDLKKLFPK